MLVKRGLLFACSFRIDLYLLSKRLHCNSRSLSLLRRSLVINCYYDRNQRQRVRHTHRKEAVM